MKGSAGPRSVRPFVDLVANAVVAVSEYVGEGAGIESVHEVKLMGKK